MEDAVSQVQDDLAHACAVFFNLIGTLQRDAPPAAAQDEEGAQEEAQERQASRKFLRACDATRRDTLLLPSRRPERRPHRRPLRSLWLQVCGERMAKETLEALQRLERSISRLPSDLPPEDEALREAVAAESEQAVALGQLRTELAGAEAALVQLRQLHGALADAALGVSSAPDEARRR
jgi:hypothetical protein